MGQLWNPLPHEVSAAPSRVARFARHAVAAWYVAVFLAALCGLARLGWRLWRPPWIWALSLVVVFSLIHAGYWSNIRMRAPLTPVAALVAAFGLAAPVSKKPRSEKKKVPSNEASAG
jgi:hypothetical protein